MHADAHFARGASHIVCEDFGWAESSGPAARCAFAVLSDGCSSASHSDLGARILTLCTARILRQGHAPETSAVLQRACLLSRSLGLSDECLRATLLWAREDAGAVEVSVRGDGVVAARRFDGELEVWRVDYPSGAPDYPIYDRDAPAGHPYRLSRSDRYQLHHYDPDRGWSQPAFGGGTRTWRLPRDRYRLVALMTDGVAAVQGASLLDIARALTDIRSPRGRFAARRLRAMVARDCVRRQWVPQDDVGVAALSWGLDA